MCGATFAESLFIYLFIYLFILGKWKEKMNKIKKQKID